MRRFYIQSNSQNCLGVGSAHNKDTYTMGFPWSYIHCGPLDGWRHILQSSIGPQQMKWFTIWSKGQNWMWIRRKTKSNSWKLNQGRSHNLMIFGAHMNILFSIKVKILMLINWSYSSSLSQPPPLPPLAKNKNKVLAIELKLIDCHILSTESDLI